MLFGNTRLVSNASALNQSINFYLDLIEVWSPVCDVVHNLFPKYRSADHLLFAKTWYQMVHEIENSDEKKWLTVAFYWTNIILNGPWDNFVVRKMKKLGKTSQNMVPFLASDHFATKTSGGVFANHLRRIQALENGQQVIG